MIPAKATEALERYRARQRIVKEQALKLYDQKQLIPEIAKRLGLAQHTVRGYVRQRRRASGSEPEIKNHQVTLNGEIYVDVLYLMSEYGLSQPWIDRLLKQIRIPKLQAIGNRGFRLENVYLLSKCQSQIAVRVSHLPERNFIRSLVDKERSPKPDLLTEDEWLVLVALVKYKIQHGGRDPRLVRLASFVFHRGISLRMAELATKKLANKGFIEIESDKGESKTNQGRFYTIFATCPPDLITKVEECPHGLYRRVYDFVRRPSRNGVGK